MTVLLDEVKKACSILGVKFEDHSGAKDANGNVVPTVLITHGNFKLHAVSNGSSIDLILQIDLRPEDTELLSKQPADVQSRLAAILKREMMEGRTGYALQGDDKGLRGIRVSQRLVVSSLDNNSVQRLSDGIQEIVVVACRCTEVLGQTFGSLKTCGTDSQKTYSPMMYR